MKYVETTRAKGRNYYYYRRKKLRVRLPNDPASPLFAEEYQRIHASFEDPGSKSSLPGSFEHLVIAYKKSPDFTSLSDKTRGDYRRTLDELGERFGDLPVKRLSRKFVLAYRDSLAETPAKANHTMAVLRKVLNFGVDRGYIDHNPALKPGRLKTGDGYQPWPLAAIEKFCKSAPQEMALAMKLALYTGQRQGDCLKMLWSHVDSGAIEVIQSKTGAKVWIPLHKDLRETLAQAPRQGAIILMTPTNKPWKEDHFRHAFRKAVLNAGLDGLTFHGLRKTAAVMLAEAGCSEQEISAITGHRTSQMVRHYTAGARQKEMARAAIIKLEENEKQNA